MLTIASFQGVLVDSHQLGDICLQLKLKSNYWRHHHSSGEPRPVGSRSCLWGCTAFWPRWWRNMVYATTTTCYYYYMSNMNASCAKNLLRSLSIACSGMKAKLMWRHRRLRNRSAELRRPTASPFLLSRPCRLAERRSGSFRVDRLGTKKRRGQFEGELAL